MEVNDTDRVETLNGKRNVSFQFSLICRLNMRKLLKAVARELHFESVGQR